MDHKGILSSAFNMSLGFIPVIISILLCEFITQDTAIYIGTVIGIVGVYLSYHRKGILLPNFILYISAGILILLSLAEIVLVFCLLTDMFLSMVGGTDKRSTLHDIESFF